MRKSAIVLESNPLSAMNTTPLIDVMLVLLIMFIVTIPLQTHAVKLDLSQGPEEILPRPDPIKNKIIITTAGAILWNGTPISTAGLRYNLERTQAMYPLSELHLQPEPDAQYGLVDEVLAITKLAQAEKVGFVGNEAYARF